MLPGVTLLQIIITKKIIFTPKLKFNLF